MRCPIPAVFVRLAFIASVACVALQGSVIYSYTGSDFTTGAGWSGLPQSPLTISDYVSMSLSLPSALADGQETLIGFDPSVMDFQFSDGVDNIDEDAAIIAGDARGLYIDLTTDATGDIINWQVEYATPGLTPQLSVCNQGTQTLLDQCGSQLGDYVVHNVSSIASNSSPGSWSEPVQSTPEPSTALPMAFLTLAVFWVIKTSTVSDLPGVRQRQAPHSVWQLTSSSLVTLHPRVRPGP